ncbi:hypothetical protein D3C76_788840 [compost metagenome]
MKQVARLHLANLHIEEPASYPGSPFYNFQILRSEHDDVQRADELAEPALLQSINSGFFAPRGQGQLQLQIAVFTLHVSYNLRRACRSVEGNKLLVLGGTMTFGHGQNEYCLHEVGFTLCVLTEDQVHIAQVLQTQQPVIAVILQTDIFDKHEAEPPRSVTLVFRRLQPRKRRCPEPLFYHPGTAFFHAGLPFLR